MDFLYDALIQSPGPAALFTRPKHLTTLIRFGPLNRGPGDCSLVTRLVYHHVPQTPCFEIAIEAAFPVLSRVHHVLGHAMQQVQGGCGQRVESLRSAAFVLGFGHQPVSDRIQKIPVKT
jgi:hypothetical protein